MAEQAHENNLEALRDDLSKLRQQMENLVKNFEEKKGDVANDIISKLSGELEHYRDMASSSARKMYDAGQNGLEEVGEQIRNNPLASLAIAFGAGCVISCLFRRMR